VTQHKLPSGMTVDLRDHHEFTGDDVQDVWDAITAPGPAAVRDMRLALVEKLVASCDRPEKYPVPFTPQVTRSLPADDYVELLSLVQDAYDLVNGRSVIPRIDDYADPTAPTAGGSE
jgi:hypothetical protein